MTQTPRTLMSRLSAFSTMLCMVAVMLSGFASAHASVQVLEHQVAGDQQTVDGGWVASCVNEVGKCPGHVRSDGTIFADMIATHHHHHSAGEVSQGLAVDALEMGTRLSLSDAGLTVGESLPLAGRSPAMPFQPPRA
ncbi:hypothetical protein [Asticcacaulis sp. AND118]|uniref:hypothetical protein n=1 Tax=Asticcacaulis sp. AND118 TaxID=2840468 RepID=UPI001CFF7F1D|nr:hypothetical protein [Asticcacaulis sp. AND118]UDF04027.1 hypothetical protein LH365_02995 [Asticcacaulis sp. AND118]